MKFSKVSVLGLVVGALCVGWSFSGHARSQEAAPQVQKQEIQESGAREVQAEFTAAEKEELNILRKMMIYGIEETLKKAALDDVAEYDQDKNEDGLSINGQKLSEIVKKKFDENKMPGTGDSQIDVVKRFSSAIGKQMGISPQQLEQDLGLGLRMTNPDIKDLSQASVQNVADVLAKSFFSVSKITKDSKPGGGFDGRAGNDANTNDTKGSNSHPQLGNGVDPVAMGGAEIPDLEELPIARIMIQAIEILTGQKDSSPEEKAVDHFGDWHFDPNPADDNNGTVADRIMGHVIESLRNNPPVDTGDQMTISVAYPKGSPGGIQPHAMTSNMISNTARTDQGSSYIDPTLVQEDESKVPHLKYKSDQGGVAPVPLH